jgi:hypothetical protein
MPCPICGGSGACRTCNGVGSFTCSTCNGSGELGGSTCPTCNGRKRIDCNSCNGNGKCSNCGGTGQVHSAGLLQKALRPLDVAPDIRDFPTEVRNRFDLNYQGWTIERYDFSMDRSALRSFQYGEGTIGDLVPTMVDAWILRNELPDPISPHFNETASIQLGHDWTIQRGVALRISASYGVPATGQVTVGFDTTFSETMGIHKTATVSNSKTVDFVVPPHKKRVVWAIAMTGPLTLPWSGILEIEAHAMTSVHIHNTTIQGPYSAWAAFHKYPDQMFPIEGNKIVLAQCVGTYSGATVSEWQWVFRDYGLDDPVPPTPFKFQRDMRGRLSVGPDFLKDGGQIM